MAPAQVMDLHQTKTIYTHKKFKCSRYSHKKFGPRLSPSLFKPSQKSCKNQHPTLYQTDKQTMIDRNNISSAKTYKNDIFRPYALDETPVSRKRKFQEMQLKSVNQQQEQQHINEPNKNKVFAALPHTNTLDRPIPFPAAQVNLPYLLPPTVFRQQQYQFNSHTLAIILQKQQAALCVGEMLKRHLEFDLHNVWRN